jgi:uncharacterized protein (DUF1330 family)
MSAYVLGVLKMRDPSWVPEYLSKVPALVARHGGVYHVRADKAEVLEGLCGRLPGSDLMVVIEFPSSAHATAWYNDPDYRQMVSLRQQGSDVDLVMCEGLEGFPGMPKPRAAKAVRAPRKAKRAKPKPKRKAKARVKAKGKKRRR